MSITSQILTELEELILNAGDSESITDSEHGSVDVITVDDYEIRDIFDKIRFKYNI